MRSWCVTNSGTLRPGLLQINQQFSFHAVFLPFNSLCIFNITRPGQRITLRQPHTDFMDEKSVFGHWPLKSAAELKPGIAEYSGSSFWFSFQERAQLMLKHLAKGKCCS